MNNFQMGFPVCRLMLDRVQLSPSECNAVVTALVECARFAIGRHLSAADQDVLVCNYIMQRVVSTYLFKCFFFHF